MILRQALLSVAVAAPLAHASSCLDCLIPFGRKDRSTFHELDEDSEDGVESPIAQRRGSSIPGYGALSKDFKVYSLQYLADTAVRMTECEATDSLGRNISWTVRPWRPSSSNYRRDEPSVSLDSNGYGDWHVAFFVDGRQYTVRIPLKLEGGPVPPSVAVGPDNNPAPAAAAFESKICSVALEEGLSALYEGSQSGISYDDFRSDIVMFNRANEDQSKLNRHDRVDFKEITLYDIGQAANEQSRSAPSVCYSAAFYIMWSANEAECANKKKPAWGKPDKGYSMCFIYKDWYFPVKLSVPLSPLTCSTILEAGLNLFYRSALNKHWDAKQVAPIEVEEDFKELADRAAKTPKSKRPQLLVDFRERKKADGPERLSLIDISRAKAIETPACGGADDLYAVHIRLLTLSSKRRLPQGSGLDNIVIVGHHEASHLVEVRLAGNNDSKALGVLTAEPEKILSRVGLDCKLTMKYVVSAAYGPDYDPDELSLTALLGDIRQTLISFRVHTLPPGTKLQHVTFGSLEDETLQLNSKKSQGMFKSKASQPVVKQRTCSLRSTPGLTWQSYDKGQYKGSFLPLSKALTTERKNRYVVVFAFGDKTFPVPVEKILRTTGALICEEAFIAAFHALYETKPSLKMETMTPYEFMSDMGRYLAVVLEGEKVRKSKKGKELADMSEFPVQGRSTAQISTAMDNDIRVKNANRRASQRRREHAEVAQRESGLRPPPRVDNAPESSDSKKRTLEDAVKGLIPQRGTSEVKGLPESMWTCTPLNSQVVWSWPRKSFELDDFPEKSEVVVVSKGKVRLRFPFGREDLHRARHDDLLQTICRLALEKAVAVRYKSKAKSLEQIALKKFEDDIRKKERLFGFIRRRSTRSE